MKIYWESEKTELDRQCVTAHKMLNELNELIVHSCCLPGKNDKR